MKPILSCAALLSLACAATSAEDLILDDVRLQVALMPKDQDVQVHGRTTGGAQLTGTDEEEWDRRFRLGISRTRSLQPLGVGEGGPIGAIGLALDHADDEVGGVDSSQDAALMDVRLGWAQRLTEAVHLEFSGVAGIGVGRYEVDGLGEHLGLAYELGLVAGGYWTSTAGYQVGLEAGWMRTSMDDVSLDDSDLDADGRRDTLGLDSDLAGACVALTLGRRF